MCEPRNLINVLKTQSTSKIIQKLTPDNSVPNISQAINLVENYPPTDTTRYNSFHVPRQVTSGTHFAFNMPMKREHYKLLIQSKYAMNDFNLCFDETNKEDTIKILSGNKVFYSQANNIFPYSLAYAGFQFGQFAGQLGDGRLVNLFDIKDRKGNWQTLQVKGSGLTPFSRFGDGKAVLRSSIREFIISESLYHIGIPSTRAIQLTLLPGTKAMRNGILEPCAIVCRFAPTWIRLGNFDLFRLRPNLPGLVKLTNYCIDEVFNKGESFPIDIDINLFNKDYFPEQEEKMPIPKKEEETHMAIKDISKYDLFYRHVVNLNAKTVAYWQSYGFLNGVLNTDNTSIMGLSIDFGPFNFLDRFEPDFTPNHDDSMKRYCFQNQPDVIWWNLIQLGQSLSILIGCENNELNELIKNGYDGLTVENETKLVKRATSILYHCYNEYKYRFTTQYSILMSKRLGIELSIDIDKVTQQDELNRIIKVVKPFCDSIIEPLLKILQRTKIDYNNFFINLQNYTNEIIVRNDETIKIDKLSQEYLSIFFTPEQLNKLNVSYKKDGKNGEIRFLEEILDDVIEWTDSYSRLIINNKERITLAKKYNPLFIPRSWILDEVIEDLTVRQRENLQDSTVELDTTLLDKLLKMSTFPYDPSKWDSTLHPEKETEWTNLSHTTETLSKSMKQSTCSS